VGRGRPLTDALPRFPVSGPRENMPAVGGPLPASARREARSCVWAVSATLASAAVTLLIVQALGTATRSFAPPRPGSRGPEVIVVRSGREALAAWHARGVRGRILVHAGRFLHFMPDEGEQLARELLIGPGTGRAFDERVVASAGPRDYLWVAASAGIIRRIIYLSPPAALDQRLADLHAARAELPLTLASEAFPRELRADLPASEEPLLLEVSASWFDDPRAPDLLSSLRAARLRADLVVVNLAEDADDVSGRARLAARRLAAGLASGDAGGGT
jgi:hypothetical protein